MNHFNIPGLGVIPTGKAFELGGVKYPANWLENSDADWRAEHNVTPANAPEPPSPPEPDLATYTADKRRALGNGSITINLGGGVSVPVWVDPESRVSLLGLVDEAKEDPAMVQGWKGADGAFYGLSAAMVILIGRTVRTFIKDIFTVEGMLQALISNGVVTSVAEVDAAEWPSTEITPA